jgi:predicted ATPase
VSKARCYGSQGQLAYAPVAEWLRSRPLRAACSLLPQSQLAELARVLPEILANAAIPRPGPLTESWERHHFYDSLNAVFARVPKPLLLLIDDLQWCDRDTFEWLHSLFHSETARGILVLATVRPEETGRDHPFNRLLTDLHQSGQALEFPLDPLNPQETAELAAQISTDRLNDAAAADLFRFTKGNPLFVVESVRAGMPNTGAEPSPRIYAVIAARFGQLSPRAYELAGLAGAIGKAFSFDLLAKATDWDEDSVSRALDELWQRRIIGEQRESGHAEYDFTHDRLREVAYAELSPVRRRFLHRRIAHALEEIHPANTSGVSAQLAAHYDAAGMAESAIRYYRQAAVVASQRYADAEAAGLLRRALALCSEFPETAVRDQQELDVLADLGPALVTTQGYAMPEVGRTYERALALSRRLSDSKHLFSILSGSSVFHIVRGQFEASLELAKQFFGLAAGQDGPVRAMAGHFLQGTSLFHLGQFAVSRDHFQSALEAYGNRSHSVLTLFTGPDIGVFCQSYLSHVLWHLGDTGRSADLSTKAIAHARELSHPFSMAVALNYAAMLHVFRRETANALSRAQESAAVCREYAFAYYLSMAEILAGWAHSREGAIEAGLTQLRHGMEALKATGAELRLPFYHGLLAEAYAAAGQPGEGLAHISIGFAFLSKNREAWAAADLHRIQGDLLLHGGNPEQAAISYRRGVEAAEQMGAQVLVDRLGTL